MSSKPQQLRVVEHQLRWICDVLQQEWWQVTVEFEHAAFEVGAPDGEANGYPRELLQSQRSRVKAINYQLQLAGAHHFIHFEQLVDGGANGVQVTVEHRGGGRNQFASPERAVARRHRSRKETERAAAFERGRK